MKLKFIISSDEGSIFISRCKLNEIKLYSGTEWLELENKIVLVSKDIESLTSKLIQNREFLQIHCENENP